MTVKQLIEVLSYYENLEIVFIPHDWYWDKEGDPQDIMELDSMGTELVIYLK